jgi:tight adherence protein C
MTIILVLGLALTALATSFAIRAAAGGRARGRAMLARIGSYGFSVEQTTGANRDSNSLRDLVTSTVMALGRRYEHALGRAQLRELRSLLDSAGLYRTSVTRYLGYRVLATACLPLVLLMLAVSAHALNFRTLFGVISLTALGWVLPPFQLKRRARTRIEQIDHEVPELVDLLVTTVEAGVGFIAALQLSARRVEGPLGQELRLALREQSMGLTLNEALANLLARADSTSLRAFVQAIVQGETLGVSIGKILRDLATEMRKRRRQAAEERAQKAPTKVVFPLVGLILPAIFIVTLGPLAYSFLHSLSGN